jgi:hypothetical protein
MERMRRRSRSGIGPVGRSLAILVAAAAFLAACGGPQGTAGPVGGGGASPGSAQTPSSTCGGPVCY